MHQHPSIPITAVVLTATVTTGIGLISSNLTRARSQQAETIALECRSQEGPWLPCRMGINRIGSQWWIEVAQQRIRFEHDGSGSVRMQSRAGADWIPVQSSWAEEQVLCWGSLCARGAMPLD
ncbi:MAG: hypothetical protein CMN97_07445 [Synechococcus sp. NAT40]|nr:hypothetical protein [Synechococcus sp. NAT40]MAS28066.1 hypothetical protein [Synechococcus sp. NAT40]